MENENNPLNDLVQHALDQDFNKANQVFGELMGQKINDILDQKQIEIASSIYNDADPEEDDYEAGDDDIDQQDDTDLEDDDEEEFDEEDLELNDEEEEL